MKDIDIKNIIKGLLNEDLSSFTGWVNIKSDMEIHQRITRMMLALGFNEVGSLSTKLNYLSDPTNRQFNRPTKSFAEEIQRKITAIIILQFLRELRNEGLFDPSTSGFLFEPFMAGLLGGDLIRDYGKVDVIAGSTRYQIKLYGSGRRVDLRTISDVDRVIFGFKHSSNDVTIYDIHTRYLEEIGLATASEQNLNRILDQPTNSSYRLNLSNLDVNVANMLGEVHESVTNIWKEVSKLHFNIESMMSGIDEEGVTSNLTDSAESAKTNALNIQNFIDEFIGRTS